MKQAGATALILGIQRADESGQCAAARTTDGSQTGRVYFGPGGEVVDGAFRIPNEVAGNAFAGENALRSGLYVLGDRPAGEGTVHAAIVGLLAFALADGIECQHDEAFQREIGGEALAFRFAFLGMARLQKDAGISAGLGGAV